MDGFAAHSEIAYWFALLRAPASQSDLLRRLLLEFEAPNNLFTRDSARLYRYGLNKKTVDHFINPPWDKVERDLNWIQSPVNHLVTFQDDRYPALLKAIPDPPLAIYLRGDPDILASLQISIVGSRRPTPDGKRNTREFADQLARLGVTITSGLAAGLDSEAHRATLDAGGRTIAVLGSGLDVIYPAFNRNLAEQIIQKGAVISELPPEFGPKPMNFPQRNRIISGLSVGTVVVEAAAKSGSLITARLAMEQGREVFAVPGSIHNPMVKGCHELIQQGAKLVDNISDILEEISPLAHFAVNSGQKLSEDGKRTKELDECSKLLLDNIGTRPVSIDFLVETTKLAAPIVTAQLLKLEIEGLIESSPGGKYTRI